MRLKMDNLDIYNNSAQILEKKTPKKILSWISTLILVLIVFVIISFIPFNIYKPYIGELKINNDITFFVSKLESKDFPLFRDKKLYIKGIRYDYEIVNIQDDSLILKIDLNDSLKFDGNIITVNILEDRTTLFKIFVKKIKKGFGL